MMKEFYVDRINNGWTLPEIDNSDFFYWLDLMAYMAKEAEEKSKTFIEQTGLFTLLHFIPKEKNFKKWQKKI